MCLVMEIHDAWSSPSPSLSFVHSSSTLLPFLHLFAQWLELILVWWFCYCVLIWEAIFLLVTGSLYKFFVLLDLTRNSWVLCLLFIETGRNSWKDRGSIEMEQILGTNGLPMDGALVVLGHIIHNIISQTACCTKVSSEVPQQPRQPPKCQESWPSLSVAFFSSLDFCFGALSKSSWWILFSNYLSWKHMWSLELSQLIVKLKDGALKCQVCPICCYHPACCNHDPEILKFLSQEKDVALNLMVCFGIHLQGLWDWNFGILTSGYLLLSRRSLGSHIVWFSWWVCKFAMVAISPPTLCAETQWWIMRTQSS